MFKWYCKAYATAHAATCVYVYVPGAMCTCCAFSAPAEIYRIGKVAQTVTTSEHAIHNTERKLRARTPRIIAPTVP